jgi:hypothetical protein
MPPAELEFYHNRDLMPPIGAKPPRNKAKTAGMFPPARLSWHRPPQKTGAVTDEGRRRFNAFFSAALRQSAHAPRSANRNILFCDRRLALTA